MNYLDFKPRDTYLILRKQWSSDYQAAVKAVRQAKIGIKEAMRAGEFTWPAYNVLRAAHETVQKLQSAKYAMKAEAQRQYLART